MDLSKTHLCWTKLAQCTSHSVLWNKRDMSVPTNITFTSRRNPESRTNCVLSQAFCQLENQNDWSGWTQEVDAISGLTMNLRRALLLQVNSRLRSERSGSLGNSPRSVHPGFSGRWVKLWATLAACVFPVSFLLPQCPDTEINKIGAQSVSGGVYNVQETEQTCPRMKLVFILILIYSKASIFGKSFVASCLALPSTLSFAIA